ncbi:MAG: DNA primase, partial [Candidatus Neomarinimicrobiota bacterium]
MARIPAGIVEQIKQRADILDVVSDVVQLKQRGRNYFGLCPFHDEKTPSFSVNPAKGIFHCFGCGKGGNAVTFIMEYENIEYVEALRRLADRYGIRIEWEKSDDDFQKGETALLYEIHEIARDYFVTQLNSEKGQKARDYLLSRGFDQSVLGHFSVGFAPDQWDGLIKVFDPKKFTPKILEKSGLFIRKDGRFLDRFRNRIMFPICNVSGRIVAFGGRTMDEKEPAKYLNSPETPIYFKSGTLYGLEHSKTAIQKEKEAVIVEGYTDFIRFYDAGIRNVVAGSGTALNFHHARLLKRFATRTVLCYDGDNAGQKAAERAGFMLIKEGFDVQVIRLPEQDDPDSFLQKNGAEAFKTLKAESPMFINYYIDRNREELKTSASKARFVEDLVREISEVNNPVVRDFIVKEVADQLQLKEERIQSQIRNLYRRKRSGTDENRQDSVPTLQISTVTEKAEFELLKLLISGPDDAVEFILNNIPRKSFQHPVLSTIAKELYKSLKKDRNLSEADLYDREWNEKERLYLSRLIVESESVQKDIDSEGIMKLIIDCMTVIMTDQLE